MNPEYELRKIFGKRKQNKWNFRNKMEDRKRKMRKNLGMLVSNLSRN